MARPIGLAKTGGRKMGVPNKRSTVFLERLEQNGKTFVAPYSQYIQVDIKLAQGLLN
jgi:hypothetical protein